MREQAARLTQVAGTFRLDAGAASAPSRFPSLNKAALAALDVRFVCRRAAAHGRIDEFARSFERLISK
jgi:hypothetical protein